MERMLVFVQEPRRDRDGHAYNARLSDLDGCYPRDPQVRFDLFGQMEDKKIGTLTKRQKEDLNEGIAEINEEKEAFKNSYGALVQGILITYPS